MNVQPVVVNENVNYYNSNTNAIYWDEACTNPVFLWHRTYPDPDDWYPELEVEEDCE